jgi:hypothetical protein
MNTTVIEPRTLAVGMRTPDKPRLGFEAVIMVIVDRDLADEFDALCEQHGFQHSHFRTIDNKLHNVIVASDPSFDALKRRVIDTCVNMFVAQISIMRWRIVELLYDMDNGDKLTK